MKKVTKGQMKYLKQGETRNRKLKHGCQGLGEEGRKLVFKENKVSVLQDEKVLTICCKM